MCAPLEQAPPTLAAAVDRAHCWFEHALGEPGRTALASVWWLSTHLATVDRVVHPVASRTLPAVSGFAAQIGSNTRITSPVSTAATDRAPRTGKA